ncbi:MAG: sigma-70 family RNA polymerase sigma factor [Lachnospiraceae bacterium]|nr:sigma-70 family RNA polymerase sigma factor [Lachnospiraceae bacterium]
MNNKDKEELREIIQDEVSKQLNKYFEKEPTQSQYGDIKERLYFYYSDTYDNSDIELENALKYIQSNYYYKAIELRYKKDYTYEVIAEIMGVDYTTISRNEKKLLKKLIAYVNK